MHEIVIISGKGGTGKTSVCAGLAHLMGNGVICDLDVDTPDMHIILKPEKHLHEPFISGHTAWICGEKCTACGKCLELCRFEAVEEKDGKFAVNGSRCEGCGVCVDLCPAGAVDFPEKTAGDWYVSSSRFGPMIHARLFPGEENSGRLVTLLKQKAKQYAVEHGLGYILCDGSPGIGCPVISSLSGASLAAAVVEPTPSGLHDFVRVADLCDHFRIPLAVIINKADLNKEAREGIESFCAERGYGIAGCLPFSQDMTQAMIRCQAVTETESALANALTDVWQNIQNRLAETKPKN